MPVGGAHYDDVSIIIANRVHPLISLREDDVPSAKFVHPPVIDNTLYNWNVEYFEVLAFRFIVFEFGFAVWLLDLSFLI